MDREEKIRIRAHQIWESEGKPFDREKDHWDRARQEIDAEEDPNAEGAEKSRAVADSDYRRLASIANT